MSFTLAGASISSAVVRVPRFGLWTARVACAGPLTLTVGARATLIVGDLSLVGTVVDGGTFAEQSVYSLVGGAGRWGATVPAKAHRSDGGVTVAEVARDLATDAGEIGVVLEPGAERPLGYAWERRAGVASDMLRQLVGDAWWAAPDGTTHLGPRPARAVTPSTLRITSYDPAVRFATASLDDDAVAQLLPGAQVTATGLPDVLDVGALTIRVEAEAIEVDLLGERPPNELLAAFFDALAARARLGAPQLHQVTEDAQGRSSCRPAGPSAASLPEPAWIDRAFGVPGVTADLAPGALVLVSLLDGSPGAPRVVGYLPGASPLTLGFSATTRIHADAPSIELGGTAPVASAINVNLSLGVLAAAINSLGGAVPTSYSTGFSKLKGG
jgi:hypothetical protein